MIRFTNLDHIWIHILYNKLWNSGEITLKYIVRPEKLQNSTHIHTVFNQMRSNFVYYYTMHDLGWLYYGTQL